MKISKSNYEVFFLDYFEGNLTEEQVSSLMAFLEKNPELKAEFESFEMVEISESSAVSFPDKLSLKVPDTSLPVTESNFEWFCVAKIEKDLSSKEEESLHEFIQKTPQKKRELELYEKTILKAENDIVFEKPQTLKRFHTTPFILTKQLWSYASAAAVVLIMAGLFFMMPKQKSDLELAVEDSHITPDHIIIPSTETIDSEMLVAEDIKEQAVIKPAETKQKDESGASKPSDDLPAPLLASNISLQRDIELQAQGSDAPNVKRETTTRVAQRSAYPMYAQQDQPEEANGQFSLTQAALAEFENRTNYDVDAGLARNRMSIWDVAGAGLARLSNVTGDPLTVEKERADDGRIIQFALGDRFSFSRR